MNVLRSKEYMGKVIHFDLDVCYIDYNQNTYL